MSEANVSESYGSPMAQNRPDDLRRTEPVTGGRADVNTPVVADDSTGDVGGERMRTAADMPLAPGTDQSRQSDADSGPQSRSASLVSDAESLRRRWDSVQVGFVDDPRQAVGEADSLVSSAIDELAAGFRRQREGLEAAWAGGNDVSTDQLRDAFRLYREFFERLLQV